MRFVAPGKVVLLGEYAVLDGAPALVAGVDRGVQCTVTASDQLHIETPGSDDRFVRPALVAAQATPAIYRFDAYNPTNTASKAGLGSSAAATVVACLAAHHGRPTPNAAELHAMAFGVHHRVQGSGSGIDVAASAWGGVLRFQNGQAEPVDPGALELVVVWSGDSANTGPRVQRYLAWSPREAFVRRSSELVDAFPHAPIATIREARLSLESMAERAGVHYRTTALDRIAVIAEHHGGAAKPSGAGGGDVAIALLPNASSAHAFRQACRAEGLHPIDCKLAPGAHQDLP